MRINQEKVKKSCLFLSNSPNFWVRNYGADSLVNETFESVHSLPSSRVTQRCPSSWPSQVGHPLLHHHPAQDLWLCHSEELPESLPYNSEDQKEEVSQQHWSCSAEIFLSTSRGSQDSHQSGELYRSLHFPKNEYKAAVMQVWNASQCRDQTCSSLPEPMLEGTRKSPLPTRANAQKNQERLMIACLCQGFVLAFAEFFPHSHLGFLSVSFVQMSSKYFHLHKPVRLGMFHSDDEMVQSNYLFQSSSSFVNCAHQFLLLCLEHLSTNKCFFA